MDTFKKIIRPGEIADGDIFCRIEYKDKKGLGVLSISGVVGPMRNGNAKGSCGQIDMSFEHRDPKHNDKRTTNSIKPSDINFAEGWNADKWYDFLEYWHDYHLNDMTAGCEHLEVPESVLQFLKSLPDTDKDPAWV